MRVLFIYPSIDCPPGINHGLAAMSGVLKDRGHEVDLLHVNEKLWDVPEPADVVAHVEKTRPDIVGFSVMSQQWDWSCEVSRALRARFAELPQAVGGVHCTMVPDEVNGAALFRVDVRRRGGLQLRPALRPHRRGWRRHDHSRHSHARDQSGKFLPESWEGARNVPLDPYPDLGKLPPKDYDLFDIGHITHKKDGWMGMITSRGLSLQVHLLLQQGDRRSLQGRGRGKERSRVPASLLAGADHQRDPHAQGAEPAHQHADLRRRPLHARQALRARVL